MTGNHDRTSFIPFVIGYLALFYLTLWMGMAIFPGVVKDSWAFLGEYTTKMIAILLGSPFVGVLFGSWAASVSIMSYTAMGSHRLGPSKFFGIGWLCILLSNMLTLSMALRVFINEKIGREWIHFLGQTKFNAWFFILAPSLGFAGGVAAVILIRQLTEAQKS